MHRQFDQLVSDINWKVDFLCREETPTVWSFTSFSDEQQIVSISPLLTADLTDLYHQFSSCFHVPSLCSLPLLFAFLAQQMSSCPQPTCLCETTIMHKACCSFNNAVTTGVFQHHVFIFICTVADHQGAPPTPIEKGSGRSFCIQMFCHVVRQLRKAEMEVGVRCDELVCRPCTLPHW